MAEIANNTGETSIQTPEDHVLSTRIFRVMVLVSALAVVTSAFVAPWRFTSGLLIGGLLAILSHHWLTNSAAAAIRLSIGGGVQQFRLFQFLFRYIVIAAAVFAAYGIGLASLPAMLVGLNTFVVALFVEALREFYFAIIRREETN